LRETLKLFNKYKDETDPKVVDELFEMKQEFESQAELCRLNLLEITKAIIIVQNNILRERDVKS